jgi:hypothetical protein
VTERQDLMYGGGDDAWSPGYIDQDSDDYFGSELPPWIRDVMRDPILVSPLGPSPDRARARRVNPPSFPPLVDDVIEPA